MVHMSYVPAATVGPQSTRTYHSDAPQSTIVLQELVPPPEIQRRGSTLGPRTWSFRRLRRRSATTSVGRRWSSSRSSSSSDRAALRHHHLRPDPGRPGHHHPGGGRRGPGRHRRHLPPTCATVDLHASACAAESAGRNDVGWMDKGTCGTSGTTITCVPTEAPCPSNANNTCLTVTVTYNYNSTRCSPSCPGWASSRRRPSRPPTSSRSRRPSS